MKNIIKIIIFAIMVIMPIIIINYTVDAANMFHDIYKEVAEQMLSGNNVAVLSGNVNERLVRKNQIEKLPKECEYLVIGSSVVMTMDSKLFDSSSCYNLGESGADFYDILAQFALLKINGVHAQKIILAVEPDFFSLNYIKNYERHNELMSYSNYMIDYLEDKQFLSKTGLKKNFAAIISKEYFLDNLKYLKKNGFDLERYRIVDFSYEGAFYNKDGSYTYSKEYQNRGFDELLNDSFLKWKQHYSYEHINEYAISIFEKLVCYLNECHTEVIFYFPPKAPVFYDNIDESKYSILFEIDNYVREFANNNDIIVLGSYDPRDVGLSNEDFYDIRHVRKESLVKLINF